MRQLISLHRSSTFARILAIAPVLLGAKLAIAETELVTRGIVATPPAGVRSVKVDGGYMVPYIEKIPGTDVSFEMIPVPGGEFLMGSPAKEAHRNKDEGPQVRVKVEPFWIGKCEVTWAEYRSFMAMYDAFKKLQRLASNPGKAGDAEVEAHRKLVETHAWNGKFEEKWNVDGVTCPTPLTTPRSPTAPATSPISRPLQSRRSRPANTRNGSAASRATTIVCRPKPNGNTRPAPARRPPIHLATIASKLGDYAWFDDNGDSQTHPVGTKKPNPWGLYDMHGNVAEWTLDQYLPNAYAKDGAGPVDSQKIVQWPTKTFPRVVRGGSWLLPADAARSAARQPSEEKEWKLSDPNIPLSPWWYTEEPATGVGMRIMRPLKPLSADEKKRVWEADVDDVRQDVKDRLREGRGALGIADKSLPAAVEAAEKLNKSQ